MRWFRGVGLWYWANHITITNITVKYVAYGTCTCILIDMWTSTCTMSTCTSWWFVVTIVATYLTVIFFSAMVCPISQSQLHQTVIESLHVLYDHYCQSMVTNFCAKLLKVCHQNLKILNLFQCLSKYSYITRTLGHHFKTLPYIVHIGGHWGIITRTLVRHYTMDTLAYITIHYHTLPYITIHWVHFRIW